MNRRRVFNLLENGDIVGTTDSTALHLPTVSTTYASEQSPEDWTIQCRCVGGPKKRVAIVLRNFEVTVDDSDQGDGYHLLDFPKGAFRITSASASLTFTTTSVIADTLNASKTIHWGVGTQDYDNTRSTGYLVGPECDILPATAATSSATIDTVNTATDASRWTELLIHGNADAVAHDADTTATSTEDTGADVYLNISVPTGTDIDADATVEVNGTIYIDYEWLGAISPDLAVSSRMPTMSLWANCPWADLASGVKDGFVFWDDFTGNGLVLATNNTTAVVLDSNWTGSTANGSSVVRMSATEPTGVVELFATDDNQDSIITACGGRNTAGQIVFTAGKRVWMECRVKRSVITDSKAGIFVGFAEEALCDTTEVIAAAGTLADKDYIAFHALEADGDKFDVVYNTAAGGGSSHAADAVTVAATTWIKLGMYCDGVSVYFYADGTQVGTALALSAANVPDGEEMAFYIAQMPAHADDHTTSVDWVKIAMER